MFQTEFEREVLQKSETTDDKMARVIHLLSYLLTTVVAVGYAAGPGGYAVNSSTIANIPDLTRGEPYTGMIYYPVPGNNHTNTSNNAFPVVVFGHPKGPMEWKGYMYVDV